MPLIGLSVVTVIVMVSPAYALDGIASEREGFITEGEALIVDMLSVLVALGTRSMCIAWFDKRFAGVT